MVLMKRLELDFKGKTVLITGAATGIGRATALAFAAAGAAVLVGDVDARAEETVRDIIAGGGKAVFQKTDVSDSAQVKALVARAVAEFGSLDVAFNNAGLLPPTAPLAEQTEADWARIIGVDVTGVFLCLKHELAHMGKAGRGVIVNTASVAGLRADPGMAPYVAAKHAVVGLTKAAAIDYATAGIRVNAIAPGLVRTPMTDRWLNDPEMREKVLADSPIRRAAEPEDIAGLVLFLASDLASVITGAVYPVDGARTAH
jgi:NAD(P)-dependent dehydrogenase (short-subunit alcohol dehydrogenase family)